MTKPAHSPLAVSISLRHWREFVTFVRYIWQRFGEDGCSRSAAALTYMSLFAVVPLLTVVFAMLSAIPTFNNAGNQVQNFLFEHFLPASGQEIQSYLLQFSTQARKLTGVGIAFLVVTALTMLTNVEKEFNAIWRTRGHRSGVNSFLLYWAILSLGPLFIGLAIGISTYIASLHLLFSQVDILGVHKLLLTTAPFFLTSTAFTLLFAAVPNCRVPLLHALIGGTVSGVFFELAKQLFALVMAHASYQLIYGTFAAIPLFLLWIYTSWVIVLIGAEIVQGLSGYTGRDSHLPELVAALAVLQILWRNYQAGTVLRESELLRKQALLGHYTLSAEHWATLRGRLLDAGLLKIDANGDFLLGRDLHQYPLWDLAEHLQQVPAALPMPKDPPEPWLQHCQQLFAQMRAQNRQQLQISLAAVFEEFLNDEKNDAI